MWSISFHWFEFVIRAVVVYLFLLFALRYTGKRQIGQMAPFDLVLLLVLSNAVQNSMNGGDNSITGGIILATTLILLNLLLGWLTYRSPGMEALIEGRPVILIHNGKINHAALRASLMTTHELDAALRTAGCTGPAEVRIAVLENTGRVSVIPHRHDDDKSAPPDERSVI